jgi:DNA-directed RNA polymerase beta subunit
MKSICLEIASALDEQGNLEEFTWDLFPVVPVERTLHLQSNGLPKIGVYIPAGGILVGKIGKTKSYYADKLPSSLEMHGLEFDALKAKFGTMWYDASVYASSDNAGVVVDAFFESRENRSVAVVIIDTSSTISGVQPSVSEVTSTVRSGIV